jgi:hypothetical protein
VPGPGPGPDLQRPAQPPQPPAGQQPAPPPGQPAPDPLTGLGPEQRKAVQLVDDGINVLIMRGAGVGKSHVIRVLVEQLRARGVRVGGAVQARPHSRPAACAAAPSPTPLPPARPAQAAVTASTGTAAINIGGQTIHSFARVGLATEAKERLALAAWGDEGARCRWQGAQALLLDKASMVSDNLFDKVEFVARYCSGTRLVGLQPDSHVLHEQPFGGVQVRPGAGGCWPACSGWAGLGWAGVGGSKGGGARGPHRQACGLPCPHTWTPAAPAPARHTCGPPAAALRRYMSS